MIEVKVFVGLLLDHGFYEIHDSSDPIDVLYIVSIDCRPYLNYLKSIEYINSMGALRLYTPSHDSVIGGLIMSDYAINERLTDCIFEFDNEEDALYFKLKYCS